MSFPAKTEKVSREHFQWDVFLSYQTPDQKTVGEIADKLSQMGLKVWWDQWEIAPGASFMKLMWAGLRSSWATIVFIGPTTIGNWQNLEVDQAIASHVSQGRPVLPVFLPGVPDPDKVDIGFLSLSSRAVFGETVDDQSVLNRIYWGITGVNRERKMPSGAPLPEAAALPQSEGNAEAIASLAQWLRTGNVTFFVGPAVSSLGPALPPRDWEIACKLLREIDLIGTEESHLLPPVDVAATMYAVSKTDPILEETVVSLIRSRSSSIPPAHQRLADLLAKLALRDRPRGRRLDKQLILTTNIDLMMERALLLKNLGFTRVVQHKSERLLYVTSYPDAANVPRETDKLEELIAGAQDTQVSPEAIGSLLEEPILYKMRGSQDIPGSCALTRFQLLAQARAAIAEHLIPAELQKIAANTPIVFLGTGVLDSDFQYISHTVLFNAWSSDHPKYLVHLAPEQDKGDGYRRMEAGIWDKIKQFGLRRNLTTVEESSERFLQRLMEAL
jgi:hypothetical protein